MRDEIYMSLNSEYEHERNKNARARRSIHRTSRYDAAGMHRLHGRRHEPSSLRAWCRGGAARGYKGFAAAVGSTVSAGVKRLITPVISAELHAPREIAEARTALAIFRIGVRCSWRQLPPSWQTQPARR